VGSLTQSSILLLKEGLIDPKRVKAVLNLTQTTSPSYILLSSIDVARKQMAIEGRDLLEHVLYLVDLARKEIGEIDGFKVVGDEYIGKKGCYSWDPSKLIVNVRGLGLSGFEVETILRREYQIQVELADLYNVLFLFSIGDNMETIQTLINALRDIAAQRVVKNVTKLRTRIPKTPEIVVSPQEAFYCDTMVISLEESEGEICAEAIMAYPPGIPIICPGELITDEIIEYVRVLKHEGCYLQGPEDPMIDNIKVIRHFVVIENKKIEEVG
jgi:arginine decarboxylase